MKQKETMFMDCGKEYSDQKFHDVCAALERGERVRVYIDCIGHSRNNDAQEAYRTVLLKKYGDRLTISENGGVCRYSYTYELN